MSDAQQKKLKSLRWIARQSKKLIKLASILLLVFAIFFALYAWQINVRGDAAINGIRQELADRDLLDLYPSNTHNKNEEWYANGTAAKYWLAAMQALPESGNLPLPAVGSVNTSDIEPKQQYHPEMISALRDVFDQHPRFLQLVEDARNAKPGRFGIEQDLYTPASGLEILGGSRATARWLQERSHLAEIDGDTGAYTESILAILELSELLNEESTIIAALVSGSIDALAQDALMNGLSRIQLSPDQLDQLADAFALRRSSIDVLKLIGHEMSWQYHRAAVDVQSYLRFTESQQIFMTRQMMLAEPEWFEDTELPGFTERLWRDGLLSTCPGFYQMRLVEYMKESLSHYDQLKQLENKPRKRAAWIKQEYDMIESQKGDYSSDFRRHMRGTNVVITARSFTRMESNLAIVIAAIKVERYRTVNNNWPAKLTDATDEPIIDAYGEPVRYRRTNEGVVLYTVGENLIDDQGFHRQHTNDPNQPADADDWAFWLYDADDRGSLKPPKDAIEPDLQLEYDDGF